MIPEALEGDSIALDYYRYRKLWERCCEVTAVKNDMTLDEVQVLVYLNQGLVIHDLKQLSDLTGISARRLGSVVQKLEKRQMIRKVNIRKEVFVSHKEQASEKADTGSRPKKRYELLAEADAVIRDLELAEMDFNEVWMRNLSEKEKISYEKLSSKIRESVRSFLRG